MGPIRYVFRKSDGKIVRSEHNESGKYTSRLASGEAELLVEVGKLPREGGVATWVVRNGELVNVTPPATPPTSLSAADREKRRNEILAIKKSDLTDAEWFTLFREFATVSGLFEKV